MQLAGRVDFDQPRLVGARRRLIADDQACPINGPVRGFGVAGNVQHIKVTIGEHIVKGIEASFDFDGRYPCRSRIFMQPLEDRHDEGRVRLGVQQRCRVPLLARDGRPARRCSRTGVFATDGSNPNTTT